MAAITGTVISAGVAGYQVYQGAQNKKKAKADMNEYERADLVNAFENMPVSTIGSDLMTDELNRGTASIIDALQQGGSRSVTAGIPRVQSMLTQGGQQVRNYIDQQVQIRDKLIAEDNANLRSIKENRDQQNLAGISSLYNSGNQDVWSGMLGLASSASALGRNIEDSNLSNINTQLSKDTQPSAPINQPVNLGMNGFNYSNPNILFDPNFGATGNYFINKKIF